MTQELKDIRVPIQMSTSEVEAIDDWSFDNRIRSRSEAIRRLCEIGLQVSNSQIELISILYNAQRLAGSLRAISNEVANSNQITNQQKHLFFQNAVYLANAVESIIPLIQKNNSSFNDHDIDQFKKMNEKDIEQLSGFLTILENGLTGERE